MILVTDRETHKSRGFGYVVFTNEEDAKEAMETMAGERGKVCTAVCICLLKKNALIAYITSPGYE